MSYYNIISKNVFLLKLEEYNPFEVKEYAKHLREVYNEAMDESFVNECVYFQ